MLHEPTPTTMAPPASTPDLLTTPSPDTGPLPEPRAALHETAPPRRTPVAPPSDLRALARRARRDTVAARELAAALLGRGWDVRRTATLAGLAESAVAALAHVRRPATAARAVADDVVARARRRVAAGELPARRPPSSP